MKISAQHKKIRKHLESGKTITDLQALKLFQCRRLAARIYDLRKKGLNIQKVMVKPRGVDNPVARYYL